MTTMNFRPVGVLTVAPETAVGEAIQRALANRRKRRGVVAPFSLSLTREGRGLRPAEE